MQKRTGWLVSIAVAGVFFTLPSFTVKAQDTSDDNHLITVYDRGVQRAFLTKEKTLNKALQQEGIELDDRDVVEPSRDEELIASEYKVNIYRARPVTVVDGITRIRIMTPYQTPSQIVKAAGVLFYTEDQADMSRSTDLVGDGAGLQLNIKRATPFIFDLYGKRIEARTQAKTVGDMLIEKNIKLGEIDRVSLPLSTPIANGIEVRVWREGKQTVTIDQPVAYAEEKIYDADRPLGYRAIQTKGVPGTRAVTYEVEIKDGIEVSRKEIASVATKQPTIQVLAIGIKGLESGLTKAKGALYFTDSKGVSHRETYYDLDMGVVMRSCGQGGLYSIRFDGVKIDADGYVIIAANYARYPKCSIVETSVGPARVYDTGGFVVRHPDGFDIATDWTNYNGR